MNTASPLRYPGGKATFSNLLASVRRLNGFGQLPFGEPFAGGAGAALTLLFREETPRIEINDADESIFSFWWSLLNRSDEFQKRLSSKRVSMAEWRRQKEVYRKRSQLTRLDRGFSAFYLNRANRSGIIMNGGPIGGTQQQGRWKIDARFNKPDLAEPCRKVTEYRERIRVSNLDGIDFIKSVNNIFLFIDPPYYEKGPTLYLNALNHSYHEQLAETLRSRQDSSWVLTYDDCIEVRALYEEWANVRPFSLRYSASGHGQGGELFISPKSLELPEYQKSKSIQW